MADEENVAAEEQPKAKRPRKAAGGAKKKKAAPKRAKKAKAAAGKRAKRTANGLRFNEERKDTYAALLRIRGDSPRGVIIERLAKNSGKKFTAEQIGKWVEWDKKKVQQFVTARIPFKLDKYPDAARRIKLLREGDGEYGLEVK